MFIRSLMDKKVVRKPTREQLLELVISSVLDVAVSFVDVDSLEEMLESSLWKKEYRHLKKLV